MKPTDPRILRLVSDRLQVFEAQARFKHLRRAIRKYITEQAAKEEADEAEEVGPHRRVAPVGNRRRP